MPISRRLFLAASTMVVIGACADDATPSADPGPTDDTTDGPTDRPPSSDTRTIVTRWASDPYARGSYSYLPVGAAPDDRRALQEPVLGGLVLAGEHTDVDGPATVHGALASGRRAAEQLLRSGVAGPVLIIGAGMAGLGAARALVDDDVDVIVIEARDRLGGRIHTDASLGIPIDLGAAWIHGVDANPVAELATSLGIEWSVTDLDTHVTFDSSGTPIDRVIDIALGAVAVRTLEDAADRAEQLDADVDVASMVDVVLDELVDEGELDDDTRALVLMEIRRTVEHEMAADLDALSSWWGDEGDEIRGDEAVLPGGYGALIDALATGIDVRLSSPVAVVSMSDGAATVTTVTGETVDGAAVIVTLPLGVLQSGAVTFDPPLPATHTAAISRLGMGLLEKVIVAAPERTWDTGTDLFGVTRDDGLFIEWLDLTDHVGSPVVVAFTAGTPAWDLVDVSDDEIAADALATLRSLRP